MSKEGLQAVVNGSDAAGGGWSSEMLRDLFTLRQDTASDTYDSRCRPSGDGDDMAADDDSPPPLLPAPEHKLQVTGICFSDIVQQQPLLHDLCLTCQAPLACHSLLLSHI